jgi:hypothetical protein
MNTQLKLFPNKFKIVTFGEIYAGKTSFILKLKDNNFNVEDVTPTLGI